MSRYRHVLVGVLVVWIVIGGTLALVTLKDSTESGRIVIGIAAAIGLGAAIGAVVAAVRGSNRQTGALLLLSAITPTGFAYLPNVVMMALGIALLMRRNQESKFKRSGSIH